MNDSLIPMLVVGCVLVGLYDLCLLGALIVTLCRMAARLNPRASNTGVTTPTPTHPRQMS